MLEELNQRFICASCSEDVDPYHYSWRACVSRTVSPPLRDGLANDPDQVLHFIDYSDSSHPHPRWQAVSADEAKYWWESADYPPLPETWLCNHCSDYLAPGPFEPFGLVNRTGSKGDAIQHVQTEYVPSLAPALVSPNSFSDPKTPPYQASYRRCGCILIPDVQPTVAILGWGD
jgi:hypothetical protein